VPFENLPYPPQSAEDRETIFRFVHETPLAYGSWNGFKSLYKKVEAEPDADPALLAALMARVEEAIAGAGRKNAHLDIGDFPYVQGCAVVGDYLFVTGGQYYWHTKSLYVYRRDSGDAKKATLVASLELSSGYGTAIESMAVCGSFLCYVLTTSSRSDNKTLQIVDITGPKYPQLRGKMTVTGAITVSQNPHTFPYLYITGTKKSLLPFSSPKSELQIVDLSAPDKPVVVGKTEVADVGNATGIGIKSYLAVGGMLVTMAIVPSAASVNDPSPKGDLRFVDVSNPKSPRVAGTLAVDGLASVAKRDSFVYASVRSATASENGLRILEVSDPKSPRLAGFCSLPGYVGQIFLSSDGGYAYVNSNGNLHTVDVRNPARPVRTATVKDLRASELVVAGDVAYVPSQHQGIGLLSLKRPQSPRLISDAPSGETMAYMKRRGRRFLRKLAKSNPARYAEVASELLLAMTGKDATIDPSRHWATIDVLFGGGNRYRQTKHGRGRYIPTGQTRSRLALRSREERSPGAWDTRPDLLRRLLQTPGLLPPVQTFAARALRSTGQELPPLPDAVLEQWLASTGPLLIALAVRMVTNRLLNGESLPPTLTADAFFQSGAAIRQTLAQTRASGWAGNKRWAESFAERLAGRVPPADRAQTRLSKRQADAAVLLARYFSWAVAGKPSLLLPMVAPLLASGRPELQSLIVAGAGQIKVASLLDWVAELARVPEPQQREATLQALGFALKSVVLDRLAVRALVFHTEAVARQIGWRLIAASATTDAVLQPVWNELLQSREATPALTTAMASPDALGLLERAGIGPAELARHLSERPFLVGLLSTEAFEAVAATAPASVVLGLVAASPESHWVTLRPVWLRQLQAGAGTAAVWLGAEAALDADDTGNLEARLLGDPEVAATLLSVDDEKILQIREPAFGPLLARWVEQYADRFTANSSLLYDAATHPLPEVRTPALARVAEVGMDMPFALRLLESAVPPSIAVGRAFFDGEPAGGEREFDYALALCDSPDGDVRRLGIDYVRGRLATLDPERILSALFENPAPEMQAFVAELLGSATIRRRRRPFSTARCCGPRTAPASRRSGSRRDRRRSRPWMSRRFSQSRGGARLATRNGRSPS
jgi:hypothetical protein